MAVFRQIHADSGLPTQQAPTVTPNNAAQWPHCQSLRQLVAEYQHIGITARCERNVLIALPGCHREWKVAASCPGGTGLQMYRSE